MSAEYEQMLRKHARGRQLTRLPSKQKKTPVILRWLASLFELERFYSEAEVKARWDPLNIFHHPCRSGPAEKQGLKRSAKA